MSTITHSHTHTHIRTNNRKFPLFTKKLISWRSTMNSIHEDNIHSWMKTATSFMLCSEQCAVSIHSVMIFLPIFDFFRPDYNHTRRNLKIDYFLHSNSEFTHLVKACVSEGNAFKNSENGIQNHLHLQPLCPECGCCIRSLILISYYSS